MTCLSSLCLCRRATLSLLLGLSLVHTPVHSQTTESLPGYRPFNFSLPPTTERMLVVDADGDGLDDLMTFAGNTVSLYFQSPAGFDFNAPDTQISFPGNAVGWDISDNYAQAADSETWSLLALIDGQQVLRWHIQERRFVAAGPLLSSLGGFLGQGVYRLNFSRDINDDGLADLIIPRAGELALHIRNPDGSYQLPLTIVADMQLRTVLTPGNPRDLSLVGANGGEPVDLTRDVGQSLRIPLLTLRDVNGDNRPDLISDTDERLDIFLANAGNADGYFRATPDYSVDRTAIRERLGEFDIDQLDFANLTGVLALTHEEILQDMNGDGIDDMILREGGRVALHLGNEDGIDFDQADQILRSGGNVLSVFLQDENADGQPDLWLWRVEQISLGDVFLWLAISGTINIEAFVYPNEGDTFARRPARRLTVALRFPSAVRMISSVQEVRDRASDTEVVLPTARGSLLSDRSIAAQTMDDLLVLLDDQVEIFYQALAPEPEADDDRFLASIGYRRDRDDYEIDVRRIIDQFDIGVNRDVNAVSDREPDISLPVTGDARRGDIITTDLNNDGVDDIMVFIERSDTAVTGLIWLSDINQDIP